MRWRDISLGDRSSYRVTGNSSFSRDCEESNGNYLDISSPWDSPFTCTSSTWSRVRVRQTGETWRVSTWRQLVSIACLLRQCMWDVSIGCSHRVEVTACARKRIVQGARRVVRHNLVFPVLCCRPNDLIVAIRKEVSLSCISSSSQGLSTKKVLRWYYLIWLIGQNEHQNGICIGKRYFLCRQS